MLEGGRLCALTPFGITPHRGEFPCIEGKEAKDRRKMCNLAGSRFSPKSPFLSRLSRVYGFFAFSLSRGLPVACNDDVDYRRHLRLVGDFFTRRTAFGKCA